MNIWSGLLTLARVSDKQLAALAAARRRAKPSCQTYKGLGQGSKDQPDSAGARSPVGERSHPSSTRPRVGPMQDEPFIGASFAVPHLSPGIGGWPVHN